MGNLFTASNQWAIRPPDQRFWGLKDMYAQMKTWRDRAVTSEPTPFATLRTEVHEGDLCLVGNQGTTAPFTHFGFGQVCGLVSAPARFMRGLPTDLASQCLNHRLTSRGGENGHNARILFHQNDTNLVVRAVTTELYDRVWNVDLVGQLQGMNGWMVPPARPAGNDDRARPATINDIIPGQENFGLSVREGDMIAPAGCYGSDHDMFVFLINPERVVQAGDRALMRGFFVRNSEVGDGSLRFDFFCMDHVCGNHIVWGVENVHTIKVRHVGGKTLEKGLEKFQAELIKYTDAAAFEQESKIKKAMKVELGNNKDDVIDAILKYAKSYSLTLITKKRVTAAYETAASERGRERYGNPKSVWGVVSGLTENSQSDWTDNRNAIDTQAGRLMEIAF